MKNFIVTFVVKLLAKDEPQAINHAAHDVANGSGCNVSTSVQLAENNAFVLGPIPRREKENNMPVKRAIDWGAVQRDRDAGMTVAKICEKYQVSDPTVYAHTHAPKGSNGRPKDKPAKATPGPPNGEPSLEAIIASLRNSLDKERK